MSKKVKYIISISIVVLIMALGIITLIMGLVPVGSNDAINLPNDVYIYTNLIDKESGKIELHRRSGADEETAKINKIFNLFNDGFRQQKALTALFRGELGKGLEFLDRQESNVNSMEKYKDEEDHITIVFRYNEKQSINGTESTYQYVCFTVTNSTELQDIVLGLPDSLTDEDSESGSTVLGFERSFEGKMVTSELYKYIYSLLEVHIAN